MPCIVDIYSPFISRTHLTSPHGLDDARESITVRWLFAVSVGVRTPVDYELILASGQKVNQTERFGFGQLVNATMGPVFEVICLPLISHESARHYTTLYIVAVYLVYHIYSLSSATTGCSSCYLVLHLLLNPSLIPLIAPPLTKGSKSCSSSVLLEGISVQIPMICQISYGRAISLPACILSTHIPEVYVCSSDANCMCNCAVYQTTPQPVHLRRTPMPMTVEWLKARRT